MRWPWSKAWTVRLVGMESGQLSPPMTFLRFRSKRAAEQWIVDRHAGDPEPRLVEWRPIRLDRYGVVQAD